MTSEASPPMCVFPPVQGEALITVARIIDGDTIQFGWLISDTARLWGVNAPEVHGPTKEAGLAATNHLRKLILDAGPILRVKIHGRDKYGRALLELLDPARGRTLNQAMLDAGHATPYLQDRK